MPKMKREPQFLMLLERLWVTICNCTCHFPNKLWLYFLFWVHDFWDWGKTSLFV